MVGSTIRPLSYGCITTPAGLAPETRLQTIHQEITKLLIKDKPSSLAIEDLFFASNAKTVIPVGQARGVILLAASEQNIRVASYSPRAVKSTIAGDGRADKRQVLSMVMRILHLDTPPKTG